MPTNFQMNAALVDVTFDGTVTLVNDQFVIATPESSSVLIDLEKISLTFEGYEAIVSGDMWECVRLWMDLLHHQLLRHLQLM